MQAHSLVAVNANGSAGFYLFVNNSILF